MKQKVKGIGLMVVIMAFLVGVGSGARVLAQKAEELRCLQVDDYFALKNVGSPRVSPDGVWVAYTLNTKDLKNDRSEKRVWVVSTAGGEPIPMTAGWSRPLAASRFP